MTRSTLRQVVLVGIFLTLVVVFVLTFRMVVVRGESMAPTYANGQLLIAWRRKGGGALQRGDVVVLKKESDFIIKRIHRLPGEEITDPAFLESTYEMDLADYYEQPIPEPDRRKRARLFVPEGYAVVLGDNPRVSEDSRVFGPVPLRDILGVVVAAPPPPSEAASPNLPSGRPKSAEEPAS